MYEFELKIACDNQVSEKAKKALIENGYDIVYCATNEPDELWIESSLDLGAFVFISPDRDIPLYLEKNEIEHKWIEMSGSKKEVEILLEKVEKIYKEVFNV